MKILALDLATTTGWAHSGGQSGTWDLSVRKDESSGMRLLRFEGKIREVIRTIGVTVIAFETVSAMAGRHVNMDAVKLICKLQAVIERLCEEPSSPDCWGANPSTIKSHARKLTGCKGNKESMVQAARKHWPDVEIVDDNQADALWLLSLAQRVLAGFCD